jgi:membrane associated rhomboid family serine protease
MDQLLVTVNLLQHSIQSSLNFFLNLTLLLIVLMILFRVTHPYMNLLGIIPRRWYGIPGIFTSPFIHASMDHLFFNLIPLYVLSAMILSFGFDFYWNLTWIFIIVSNTLIWCLAPPATYVGASGLISAYWGFLVIEAIMGQHSLINYFIFFVCIYYFIGIFVGIFPSQKQVSWQGHLLGMLTGIVIYLLCYYYPSIRHLLLEKPYLFTSPF